MSIASLLRASQPMALPSNEEVAPPESAGYAGSIAIRLLAALQRLTLPLSERPAQLPFAGAPINPVTGHVFTGTNRLALVAHMLNANVADPRYMRFEQVPQLAEGLGISAHVRRGARQLLLMRPSGIAASDDSELDDSLSLSELLPATAEGDSIALDLSQGRHRAERFTPYGVFHASQIQGLSPTAGTATMSHRSPRQAIERYFSEAGIGALPERANFGTREEHLTAMLARGFDQQHANGALSPLTTAVGQGVFATLVALELGIQPVLPATAVPLPDPLAKLSNATARQVLDGARVALAASDRAVPALMPTPVPEVALSVVPTL